MSFRESIESAHRERHDNGLWRKLRRLESAQGVNVVCDGKPLVNFSSNDYLGLANCDQLKQVAAQAAEKWGTGSGASHLVCGHLALHDELEQQVAEFVGAEKAIIFSTGYMANLAVPAAFLTRNDLLVQDKLNHASLIDAGLLCRAESKRYRHVEHDHAREVVQDNGEQRTLIATDGVFSMNGNIAPVHELLQLCTENENRLLLVDDAHGWGVLGDEGKGTLEQHGMVPTGPLLMVGTFSKAAGSFGAFAAGDAALIEHLIQHARPFIYTTALPPGVIAASQAAIHLFGEQSWRREKLHENVAMFLRLTQENNIKLLPSKTPIQSIVFGSPQAATRASEALQSKGFLAVAIRPPTVPAGTSRLRITLSTDHEADQIKSLVEALAQVIT